MRAAERTCIVTIGALLVVLVGVSRAVLGVHWSTDVLGGWTFGKAWAIAWLPVADHVDAARPQAAAPEASPP
jgi:undecaprenyl-diphosphatase